MATRFIVSVGTSLIGNYNRWPGKAVDGGIGPRDRDWGPSRAEGYAAALDEFLRKEDLKEASAELSSLLKDPVQAPRPGDEVWLVHTRTRPAEACARCIGKALEGRTPSLRTRCRSVEGLGEASEGGFADRGLPNLIKDLVEIVEGVPSGDRCVLVPTGGYKAIIPYFVVMGTLFELDCIYIYEQSDELLTLPPLPLHVDLSRWTALESVVEALEGKSREEAEGLGLYRKCEDSLRILMVEGSDGTFGPSSLCGALRGRAQEDRRRPELQFRTRNSPLLHYLVKEDGDDSLRLKFLRLAEIGPHLWKGDQVPEMADHALLHHADLFHLAERVLLPVFYFHETRRKERFLSPEELFVLLGALHLHDCGHVLGRVDREDGGCHDLLPTEVRDHHHVLGYLRLTEPRRHGKSGSPIHEILGEHKECGGTWSPSDLENSLRAIGLVGLYHRKKMRLRQRKPYPFLEGSSLEEVPCLTEFFQRLAENDDLVMVGDVELSRDRLVLLVSLLRIIDSLDEQGSRTGGREAAQFHLGLLEGQTAREERRAAGLRKALEAVELVLLASMGEKGGNRLESLDGLIESYTEGFAGKERKGGDGGTAGGPAPSFWQTFGELYPEEQPVRPVAFEYAVARIRSRFNRSQKEHYAEKLNVEGVEISHAFGDDAVRFRIGLRMEADFARRREGRRQRAKLLESMRQEYENEETIDDVQVPVVKEALKEAGIELRYDIEKT